LATLNQRLHRKNADGTYDIVYLETSAKNVLMADGTTVEDAVNGKAATNHTHSGYASSSHSHSASNITSGTLSTSRGGTGVTSNPSMLTDLSSTTAASVFATSPRPGVTGTLPAANGGTGATTITPAVGTSGLRAIYAGTSSMTSGSTSLTTGTVYLQYE
jgi:hypothetical protein